MLLSLFNDILDVDYTASWRRSSTRSKTAERLRDRALQFHKKFEKDLKRAAKDMINLKEAVEPDPMVCDKCGSPMVIKAGRFGQFLACTGYPECKNTRELDTPEAESRGRRNRRELRELRQAHGAQARPVRAVPGLHRLPGVQDDAQDHRDQAGVAAAKPDQILDEKCPKCDSNLVLKQGRFGEFTACSSYPTCQYVKQKSTGVLCPEDGGDIVERKSWRGQSVLWLRQLSGLLLHAGTGRCRKSAPTAAHRSWREKITKRHGRQLVCNNEDCSYVRRRRNWRRRRL